eukprot:11619497-Karenia_brevis.AAC.1
MAQLVHKLAPIQSQLEANLAATCSRLLLLRLQALVGVARSLPLGLAGARRQVGCLLDLPGSPALAP